LAYLSYDESLLVVGKTMDSVAFIGGLIMKVDTDGNLQYGFKFYG